MPRGIARARKDAAGDLILNGSPNTFANILPVARIGDPVKGHDSGEHSSPVMAQGSPNVFTNSIPTCRYGDVASCGHPSTASFNVFVN
jgi:uncharacterized Zn-binding protein involved in type VI secretion